MLTVSIGLAVILGFTNIANSHDARRQGEELARQMAARYAEQTEQSLNSSMKVATLLAQTMEGMRQGSMPSRPTLDALQKRILQTNTGFINIWTLFEPNALDGRDAEFANTPHHDRSGRYVPYFTRKPDGSISQEIPGGGKGEVLEYDRPGDGDYYLVPKQRGVDTVLEPYEYDVAGQKMLLSSFVAPVKDSNGRFIGAAGVDVPLSGVQAALSQVKPFELGYVSVLSNGGVYIANPDAAKLGKPAQDLPAEALAAVKAGKTFSYQAAGNWMHFLTPIHLGQSGTPWAAMVSVPMDEVLAPAVATRNQSLLIALEHVLNHANNIRQVRQHQHGKRHVMQSSQRLRQLLVSSGQTPEASSPAKAALNYPAARQQHKATLGFWQLHHVQLYAMFASFIGGSVAGIALINKGDFD